MANQVTELAIHPEEKPVEVKAVVAANPHWVNKYPLYVIYIAAILLLFTYLCISAAIFQAVQPTYVINFEDSVANRTTSFLDALYFSAVTLTTVGYGDISPSTTASRIWVALFIIFNIVLVGASLDIFETVMSRDDVQTEVNGKKRARKSRAILKLKGSSIVFVAMAIAGFGFFVGSEGMGAVDAVYFTVVTLTTVGFGDIHPVSDAAKVFTIFWILIGCLAVLQMVGAFLDILMAKRRDFIKAQFRERNEQLRQSLIRRMEHDVENRKLTRAASKNLLASLQDTSRVTLEHKLTEYEYVVARLVQTGKISTDEVSEIKRDFHNVVR